MTEIDLPSAAQARALTDRIKVAVEGTWLLIQEAYTSRAWHVLGYESWDAYCSAEFGTSRLRLPREERQEVVSSLREIGMSYPAIAVATGLGVGTVHRAASTFPDGKVEQPEVVTGTNGKKYAATRPAPPSGRDAELLAGADCTPVAEPEPPAPAAPKPKRRPLPDAFADAARDLARAAERLTRITDDDRFGKNRETTHHQVPELLGALDQLARLTAAMRLETAEASEEARRWWATSLNATGDALRGVAHSIEKEH